MFVKVTLNGVERKFELFYRTAASDPDETFPFALNDQRVRARLLETKTPKKLLHGFVDFPGREFWHDEYIENDAEVSQYFHENPPVPNDTYTMALLDAMMDRGEQEEAARLIAEHIQSSVAGLTSSAPDAPQAPRGHNTGAKMIGRPCKIMF